MKVVVVACDELGNVDLDDLRAKIAAHADALAALMITYPSTHGVYEHDVLEITQAVHDAGGQVYVDGANLNALLGYARFGDLGGDVSHLNLHKTFCDPARRRRTRASARSRPRRTSRRTCPGTRSRSAPTTRAASRTTAARSRRRRTASPASCRSRGRTCA